MTALPRRAIDWIVEQLDKRYGRPKPPPVTDPFEMALWEAASYLVPEERKGEVLTRLRAATGLDPVRIVAMPLGSLAKLIETGGMKPTMRAEKVRGAAEIAIEHGVHGLRALAKKDPVLAKRVFRLFPGIGEPGAERMLLFNRVSVGLAPESNGLRVLLRLGYGRKGKGYAAEYRLVREALAASLPEDARWRIRAHQLLRKHGQELCKTKEPKCPICPLLPVCPGAGAVPVSGRSARGPRRS